MQKYIVTDFGPNTTIGDIKGKVLVKFAANQNAEANFGDLSGTNALFNLWTSKSSSQLNYSNLVWRSATGLTNRTSYNAPAANDMLYIHAEESNPVHWRRPTSNKYDWDTNVSSQITAYHQLYNKDTHNIFGMTYLGGAGSTHSILLGTETITPTQVADYYNQIWTNAVNDWTGDNNKKPYGWVLVNMVGITSSNNVIAKVISQNNDNNFKLNRNRTGSTNNPQQAPQGDISAPSAGGPLF